MQGKDPIARVHIINTLARFNTPEVQTALQGLLKDPNKLIRGATLSALQRMDGPIDIERVCALLRDPEIDVLNRAIDVVIKANHPDTMKYLIEVLKDENENARRAAVEVLNEVGNAQSVKYLLESLKDSDWWVRSRAADALGKIGGPKVIDAVLQLVRDKDEDIRRAAIEILNQTKDERAVDSLIQATRDSDWWVSERADRCARRDRQQARRAAPDGDAATPGERQGHADRGARARQARRLQAGRYAAAARRAPRARDPHRGDPGALQARRREPRRSGAQRTAGAGRLARPDHLAHGGRGGDRARQPHRRHRPLTSGRAATGGRPRAPRRRGSGRRRRRRPTPRARHAKTLLISDAGRSQQAAKQAEAATRLDINTLKPGDVLEGRYKYIDRIGRGAFGTVLLMEDTVVDERLILKFLNPNVSEDEEVMKRFVHELRYSRKITHKNVIRIYDFLYIQGNYAISMEYFPSHTLGSEVVNEKPVELKRAMQFGIDICTGMTVAHQVGIVHRDLKPANVLINQEGLLKIVDFGVAAAQREGDTQLTKTGYVIGSPKYMAPEQILGKKVDERADIYALGVMLYEMVTGVPPYSRGDHMSVMYQHVQGKARVAAGGQPEPAAGALRPRDARHGGRQDQALPDHGRAAAPPSRASC